MGATAWTVIGTGATILIAIGASFGSLRNELNGTRKQVADQGKSLHEIAIGVSFRSLRAEIDGVRKNNAD